LLETILLLVKAKKGIKYKKGDKIIAGLIERWFAFISYQFTVLSF